MSKDVTTRLAAVDSIANFISKLRELAFTFWSAPELLGIYFALYNIISDDDEEVRDSGAVATSNLLSGIASENNARSISLMPLAASQEILQYLANKHSNSAILWIEAAHQLTGTTSSFKLGPVESYYLYENRVASHVISLHLNLASDMLQKARRQDTALFAEEKQNLFVDAVKEAKNWAELMLKLQSRGISSHMATEFCTWCADGLKALIELSGCQTDGPLGWVSKPDVFALGMRIILATKVQIHSSSKDSRDQDVAILPQLLRELLSMGRENMLHGLWVQQIEEIIEDKPRVS